LRAKLATLKRIDDAELKQKLPHQGSAKSAVKPAAIPAMLRDLKFSPYNFNRSATQVPKEPVT